jgi:G:T/U-mismatch repair DNA glycosylase
MSQTSAKAKQPVNITNWILDHAMIRQIYVNGKTAEKMYHRYTEPVIRRPCTCLPSTSPANAAWNLEKLVQAWERIRI